MTFMGDKRSIRSQSRDAQAETGTVLQSLKKLFQCLAVLKRLVYGKSNKLNNNLKIIYVILRHLGSLTYFISCDLD
jgi:hypothetical protein